MRPKSITLSGAVLDRNGISLAQTTAGAANLTITGALASGGVATLDIPRHVGIYSAGDISSITFTVTGTDRTGATITETITGVNATTVNGNKNFKTVTRVAASAAVETNVEVGTTNEFDSQVIPVNHRAPSISYSCNPTVAGAFTYEVKYTLDNPWGSGFDESTATWLEDLGPKTPSSSTDYEASASAGPIRALRVEITGWTNASDALELTVVEAGV